MRYIVFLLFISFTLNAQESVEVYTERNGPNVLIYADNDEVIPMTIKLELDITGMNSTLEGKVGWVVIPAKAKKHLLTTASPKPRSREMTFAMQSQIYPGDLTVPADQEYKYELPFAIDKNVQVYQGYNGKFSHDGENALDFGLEIGDEVNASRGGVVYKVVDSNSESCKKPSCQKYNNYILIYHEDGTTAEYVHLKKDGAVVKVGDKVEAGRLIGYSGNTGWSSGPHLHFMVYQMTKKSEKNSLRTKFITKDKSGIVLKEKEFYQKG